MPGRPDQLRRSRPVAGGRKLFLAAVLLFLGCLLNGASRGVFDSKERNCGLWPINYSN